MKLLDVINIHVHIESTNTLHIHVKATTELIKQINLHPQRQKYKMKEQKKKSIE